MDASTSERDRREIRLGGVKASLLAGPTDTGTLSIAADGEDTGRDAVRVRRRAVRVRVADPRVRGWVRVETRRRADADGVTELPAADLSRCAIFGAIAIDLRAGARLHARL